MQYIFRRERCSVLLQKHQHFLLSISSFLSNPCLHFEASWIQNDGKGSTRIEPLFQSAFGEKLFSKKNEKFHSVSRIVSKLRKLASYRRNTKIKVFPSQLGKDKSKLSFLRTSLRFYSALVILEPQIYVIVEQFGRKISRCSAGVLFIDFSKLSSFLLKSLLVKGS